MKIKFVGTSGVFTEFGEFKPGEEKEFNSIIGMRLLANDKFKEVIEVHGIGRMNKKEKEVKKLKEIINTVENKEEEVKEEKEIKNEEK